MFFIKKLIESLIFPPGIVILAFMLIFFVSFIDFIKRKAKGAKPSGYIIFIPAISLFFAVTVYLLSIQPASNILLLPLETSYPVPSVKTVGKPSVIVVLSSGAYNRHTLDGDSFNRLFEGFKLYKKYKVPIIVSGGKAVSIFSVAKIMKNVLMAMGVKKSYIITEDKSDDTYQNALYVLRICKRRNFRRIILITSAYHMPRAMFLFNEVKEKYDGYKGGIKIIPYPADFKTDLHHYNMYGYFPQLGYLAVSAEALHEYLGYVYYYTQSNYFISS